MRLVVGDRKVFDSPGGKLIADAKAFNNYYPFGMLQPGRNYQSAEYRYGFNGMEQDNEIKGTGNSYDFGARMFDTRLGRWLSRDPLETKYIGISPFVFSLNTPIQAKDPDGQVVLFINGQHGGSGGSRSYWEDDLEYYSSNHAFVDKSGNIVHPKVVEKRQWDMEAMQKFGDFSARFYDGSVGGFGNTLEATVLNTGFVQTMPDNLSYQDRIDAGYAQALTDAADIIAAMKKSPDDPKKIVETVKIIAHSMGVAYSRGFAKGLAEYAAENKYELTIEFEIDVAVFQGSKLPASPFVNKTYTMNGDADGIANGSGVVGWIMGILSPSSVIPGAQELETAEGTGHGIVNFPTRDIPANTRNSDATAGNPVIIEQDP